MDRVITKLLIDQDPSRKDIFTNLYEVVSSEISIDKEIIANCGERSLRAYENIVGKEIITIFTLDSKEKKKIEINRMISIFREYIDPFLLWDKKIKKSMDCAKESFEKIFN